MRDRPGLRRDALSLQIADARDLLPRDDPVASARIIEEQDDLEGDAFIGDLQRVEEGRRQDVEAPLRERAVSIKIGAEPFDLDRGGAEIAELGGAIKWRVPRPIAEPETKRRMLGFAFIARPEHGR